MTDPEPGTPVPDEPAEDRTGETSRLSIAAKGTVEPGDLPDDRGHWFTIREAGDACGLSRDSIKRRNVAGRFPGARKDDEGRWLIPLVDLLGDGLRPNAPAPPGDYLPAVPQGVAYPDAQAVRLAELLAENHELRAVVQAQERTIQFAEKMLAALPAAPPPAPPPQDAPRWKKRKKGRKRKK